MISRLKITVEGRVYDVTVEHLDPLPGGGTARPHPAPLSPVHVAPPSSAPAAAAPAAAAPAGAAHSGGAPGDVISPLAGKVVSIDTAAGQHVHAGQLVATLEAMKMNTQITAPSAGTVKEILVAPGDSVEEGQTLMRIG